MKKKIKKNKTTTQQNVYTRNNSRGGGQGPSGHPPKSATTSFYHSDAHTRSLSVGVGLGARGGPSTYCLSGLLLTETEGTTNKGRPQPPTPRSRSQDTKDLVPEGCFDLPMVLSQAMVQG